MEHETAQSTENRIQENDNPPRVAVIMGSQSDWPTMQHASELLDELGIENEALVVSAHRTPDRLYDWGCPS